MPLDRLPVARPRAGRRQDPRDGDVSGAGDRRAPYYRWLHGPVTEADLTAVAGADLPSFDRAGRLRARFEQPSA